VSLEGVLGGVHAVLQIGAGISDSGYNQKLWMES
jgi:hypothetical protein